MLYERFNKVEKVKFFSENLLIKSLSSMQYVTFKSLPYLWLWLQLTSESKIEHQRMVYCLKT